jgi:hypothetical protein
MTAPKPPGTQAMVEIRVPPEVAPFMERHGQRAAQTITRFLAACPTLDEKLGALGVLAQLVLATGDSLRAVMLDKATAGKPARDA